MKDISKVESEVADFLLHLQTGKIRKLLGAKGKAECLWRFHSEVAKLQEEAEKAFAKTEPSLTERMLAQMLSMQRIILGWTAQDLEERQRELAGEIEELLKDGV